MGIVCFPIGASGYAISSASQFAAGLIWEQISDQNTDGGAAVLNFSVPAGYKKLMFSGRVVAATSNQSVGAQCNGDSGANYSEQFIDAHAAVISSNSNTNKHIEFTSDTTDTDPQEFFCIIENEASKTKTYVSHAGNKGCTSMLNGRWNNTAAEINSFSVGGLNSSTVTNLAAGCRVILYGAR